jgi:hypothetical protein
MKWREASWTAALLRRFSWRPILDKADQNVCEAKAPEHWRSPRRWREVHAS